MSAAAIRQEAANWREQAVAAAEMAEIWQARYKATKDKNCLKCVKTLKRIEEQCDLKFRELAGELKHKHPTASQDIPVNRPTFKTH